MLERWMGAWIALVTLIPAVTSASARAADAPRPPAATVAPPAAPVAPPVTPVNRTPYEAFVDIGFKALYDGDLTLAEEAFRQAAALPGDPVRASIATSFAERAARLRANPDSEGGPPSEAGHRSSRSAPAVTPAGSNGPRTTLIAASSLLGLGLYGWTLPATLGLTLDEDRSAFIGLYLMTAGAAALVPALATADVTPAQANLAFYGGTRGMWHGALLAAALFGNLGTERQYRLWAGSLLAGSVGELLGGYFLARQQDLSPGEVRTIAVGGDFGLGWGLALGAILGLQHDDRSEDAQARGIAIMGLLGATAGLSGGYVLAGRRDNTWGDGEVWRAAGLLGTGLGLSADSLFGWRPDQTDQKKFFVTLLAGGAAGLWVGDRLVRSTDFTASESVLVDLATLGGALGGAGVAYLLTNESLGLSARALLGGASLGGGLGFGLTYVSLRTGARNRALVQDTVAARGSTIAVLPMLGQKGEQGLSLAGTF